MVVPRDVSDTLSASTRMVGCFSRSMRLNRYQCCSGAGFRVMVTGLPVWSPTPEILISDLIVRCFTFIAVNWLNHQWVEQRFVYFDSSLVNNNCSSSSSRRSNSGKREYTTCDRICAL